MRLWNKERDLEIERERYNHFSSVEISNDRGASSEGFSDFPQEHIPPFKKYYTLIEQELVNVRHALEIGAGTGQHTRPLVRSGIEVTALDISDVSLQVLHNKFGGRVTTIVGNIEDMPFPDSSFDLIISCGALSYGDPTKVDREILRTLRPGGSFIFLDSLNHNPIYKINRWLRYLHGSRSLSTVLRIPKMARIKNLSNNFQESDYSYFGKWLWLHRIFSVFFSPKRAFRVYSTLESTKFKNK